MLNKGLLNITMASFEEAMELQDSIVCALKGNNIDIKSSALEGESLDLDKIEAGGFIDAALNVIGDKRVRAALFACSSRAIYGEEKNKLTKEFFEDPKNRPLYYPIMIEVLKVNLAPFIEALTSSFGGIAQLLGTLQK